MVLLDAIITKAPARVLLAARHVAWSLHARCCSRGTPVRSMCATAAPPGGGASSLTERRIAELTRRCQDAEGFDPVYDVVCPERLALLAASNNNFLL